MAVRKRSRRWWAACAGAVALALPMLAVGDARTDRLVELLERSGNYRVRVQSAQSLGRIRDPVTVPALVKALADDHPAVRAAAAQSLGRIGSAEAIAPLRRAASKSGQSAEVVRYATDAIDQIQRMTKMSARASSPSPGGPGKAPGAGGPVRFYVGVGDMGNTTGRRGGDLEAALKRMLRDELGRAGQIDIAPDGETPGQTKRILDDRGLTGYFVQGSVTRLEEEAGQVQAVVSLMVLTNPDRNLRMMLQGRGAAGAAGKGSRVAPSAVRDLEDSALQAAVRGAVSKLAGQLGSQP